MWFKQEDWPRMPNSTARGGLGNETYSYYKTLFSPLTPIPTFVYFAREKVTCSSLDTFTWTWTQSFTFSNRLVKCSSEKFMTLPYYAGLQLNSWQLHEMNGRLSSSKALLFGWTCNDFAGLLLLTRAREEGLLSYYNKNVCAGIQAATHSTRRLYSLVQHLPFFYCDFLLYYQ